MFISFDVFMGNQMTIGKKVKLARVENDLTQVELAEEAGCTRQTIGLLEANRFNPSLKLCIAIAKAVNKTLNDLFWIEEDNYD
jgi:putative transcriptional regulator